MRYTVIKKYKKYMFSTLSLRIGGLLQHPFQIFLLAALDCQLVNLPTLCPDTGVHIYRKYSKNFCKGKVGGGVATAPCPEREGVEAEINNF